MVYWKRNIVAAILDEASRSKNEENSKALTATADSGNRIAFVGRYKRAVGYKWFASISLKA